MRRPRLPGRPTQYIYGDESGGFRNKPYFLLGIIQTYDPRTHDAVIESLRQKHQYPRQFEYKKTDRLKVALCRDVIDHFVACEDLRYQALLIPTAAYDLRRYRTAGERSARTPEIASYNYRYKQIIRNNTAERNDLVITLDERTRAKNDNLSAYLQREIPNITKVHLVNSQKHNLVQLADLLTGCIYGDLTNNTHPVKQSIIEHLRARLGIQRLHQGSRRLRRKFRVYHWRPPRSD